MLWITTGQEESNTLKLHATGINLRRNMLSQRSQIQKMSTVWFQVYQAQGQATLSYVSLEYIPIGRVNEETVMLVIFYFLTWVMVLPMCSFCGSSLSSEFTFSLLCVHMYISLKSWHWGLNMEVLIGKLCLKKLPIQPFIIKLVLDWNWRCISYKIEIHIAALSIFQR